MVSTLSSILLSLMEGCPLLTAREFPDRIFKKDEKIDQTQRHLKLPAHPVKTGQARRGRSTELSALSMSKGFPGRKLSFILCPLTPSIPLGRDGARAGQPWRETHESEVIHSAIYLDASAGFQGNPALLIAKCCQLSHFDR